MLLMVEIKRVEENEKLVLTPFEKNLEVWRQLWRVVERSDLIVQIVDSRNPLLFYSSVRFFRRSSENPLRFSTNPTRYNRIS